MNHLISDNANELIIIMNYTFAYWVIFILFRRLLIFQNQVFQKILSVLPSLDQDQARRFVGPDLGPNCLLRLSADDKRRKEF